MERCTALPAASLLRRVLAGDVESSTCALCLCDQSLLPSVLHTPLGSGGTIVIAQLIHDLNIFDSEDLSSKKICDHCIRQLKNFHYFRQKCLRSASTLRNVVYVLAEQMTCVMTSSQFVEHLMNEPEKSFSDCTLNIRVDLDTVYANETPLLECPSCYKSFWTNEEMSAHIEHHRRHAHLSEDIDVDVKALCSRCEVYFPNERALEEHVCILNEFKSDTSELLMERMYKDVTKTSKLKTTKLKMKMKRKVDLIPKRMSTRRSDQPLNNCGICLKSFTHFSSLKEHYKSAHPKKPPPTSGIKSSTKKKYVCTRCDDGFASQIKLDLHTVRMHGKQKMRDVQGKISSQGHKTKKGNFAPLADTLKKKDLSEASPISSCDEDSTEDWFESYFPNEPNSLERKNTKVTQRKNKKTDRFRNKNGLLECRKCYSDFETVSKWVSHQIDHGNSPYNHCRICDKIFNGFSMLLTHFATCHPKEPLPTSMQEIRNFCSDRYICGHCNTSYKFKKYLLLHIQKKHPEYLKLNICTACNITYVQKHQCQFTCTECHRYPCIHEKYLLAHRKAENILPPKSKKTCVQCDYEYVRKADLIGHANKKHLLIKPHDCSDCGRKFPSRKALRRHLSWSHPQKCCPHCKRPMANSRMRSHIAACKKLKRSFQCGVCDQRFANAKAAENHRKVHATNMVSCRTCNVKVDRKQLKDHKIKCYREKKEKVKNENVEVQKPTRWPCPKCEMDFSSEEESVRHEYSHPLDTEYMCPTCNRTFPTKAKRFECIRAHRLDATQVCPICGRLFSKMNIHIHLQWHARKGEASLLKTTKRTLLKKFMCDICGSMHSSVSNMKKHKENHKPFEKCEHCFKFIEKRNMRRHLSVHKAGPKRVAPVIELTCNECDFKARSRPAYESHLNRVHRKIAPYKCDVCSKTFFSLSNLNSHFYDSHPKRDLKCSVCNLQCRSSKGFKLHMMQHEGDLPHSCEYCDMKFVCASRKKMHEARVHFKTKHRCTMCIKVFLREESLNMHVLTVHEGGKGKRSVQSKKQNKAIKK